MGPTMLTFRARATGHLPGRRRRSAALRPDLTNPPSGSPETTPPPVIVGRTLCYVGQGPRGRAARARDAVDRARVVAGGRKRRPIRPSRRGGPTSLRDSRRIRPHGRPELRADREAPRRGKSVREIAAELGVPTTTVYRWADPAYAARQSGSQRRWKRRNPERARADATDTSSAPPGAAPAAAGRPLRQRRGGGDPVLCCGCLDAATAERRRRVRELPARGAGPAGIAARLGLARGTVANDELRGRGRASAGAPERLRSHARGRDGLVSDEHLWIGSLTPATGTEP